MRTSKLKGFHIYLKVEDNKGNVRTWSRRKRGSMLNIINALGEFRKARVKVQYTPKYHNEGIYHNKEELLSAYRIFTERELILDITS